MSLTAWVPPAPGAPAEAFLRGLRLALQEDVRLVTDACEAAEADVRVLVAGVPTEPQLKACPQLSHLIIPYAGLPGKTRTLLRARPQIAVHNLHHNAAPAAELAVALLLAATKRLVPFDRALRTGSWAPRYAPAQTSTLEGSRALVLGYGAIGCRVARACLGLGMHVTAVRRRFSTSLAAQADAEGVRLLPSTSMQQSLPSTDAVILCLPLTEQTRGLLGADELALLPPHACLVNVGRGELVDERALFEALERGQLGSAGIDVWYRYPENEDARESTRPSAFPFQELDTVVLSPHRGGLTRQNEVTRAAHVARLLDAASRGEMPDNRVDLDRGY